MWEKNVSNVSLGLKVYTGLNRLSYGFCNALSVPTDHPFNSGEGVKRLNYADFEYESAERVFRLFDGFIDWRELLNDAVVLDVACGAGGKSAWMRENGALRVIGLDIMPLFIEQARVFCEKKQLKDMDFVLGDAAQMPIESNTVDLVILNDAMEHVSKPEETLREAMRVLKSGGGILINFEPFYHPRGGHLSDVVMIPWEHVFFSEKLRIEAYKKLVEPYQDAQDRIDFRIYQKEDGGEYFGYINGMTLKWFGSILNSLRKDGLIEEPHMKLLPFNRPIIRAFTRVPVLKEFFTKNTLCYLQKA